MRRRYEGSARLITYSCVFHIYLHIHQPPAFPAIIAREQLSRATALGRPQGDRGSIRGVVDSCGQQGRCYDPAFFREQMDDNAPRLQVFKCDVATGRVTPFVYQPIEQDRLASARGRQWGGPTAE